VRIFDKTLLTLERALDARLLRQNVLSGNLANANTPGYVPRDVDFAAAMRQGGLAERTEKAPAVQAGDIPLLTAGSPGAALGGQPGSPVVAMEGAKAGLDGNAVDVDRALAAVAENAIQYGAAARAAQKKLALLRYAASDGTA
jgi:flagellar basal-body rod protein FlgB